MCERMPLLLFDTMDTRLHLVHTAHRSLKNRMEKEKLVKTLNIFVLCRQIENSHFTRNIYLNDRMAERQQPHHRPCILCTGVHLSVGDSPLPMTISFETNVLTINSQSIN